MEYNAMDRIIKFGEGQYKYDSRGLVTQNAREESSITTQKVCLYVQLNVVVLTYVTTMITWIGKMPVLNQELEVTNFNFRLSTRKDNYGNVTQFFYNNKERPNEVTQIYSPRDGKLMSLVYDDRGHLIYATVCLSEFFYCCFCGRKIFGLTQLEICQL